MGFGDDLMVSGAARRMQLSDPRPVFPTCKGTPARWSTLWDHNPRFSRAPEGAQELKARDAKNMRPYHISKTHQRWSYNLDFRPDVGEIYFTEEEKRFGLQNAGRIIIEPHIKPGASPNKQWGWVRWGKLAWLLAQEGIPVTQMGPRGTQLLPYAHFLETVSFRMAAAVIANAKACVLPEGGGHHAAAAVGTKAVVVFGGFTPVELTGYAIHKNIGASLGEACGMRTPCEHCAKWMASIPPEQIKKALLDLI